MRYQSLGVLKIVPEKVSSGYTLVPTFRGRVVRLIDIDGTEVHKWDLNAPTFPSMDQEFISSSASILSQFLVLIYRQPSKRHESLQVC